MQGLFRIKTMILGIVLSTAVLSCASAQQWTVRGDQDWRDEDDRNERYCEIREITLAGRQDISVDGLANGGIQIEGWDRNDIELSARVCVWDRRRSDAEELAKEIEIRTDGTIRADGPRWHRRSGWSVSYRLMVPKQSNLNLETRNGGITISHVEGEIRFDATNGGIELSNLQGDVQGRTTNGGVNVELSGVRWQGYGLDVRTTNGGVVLDIPRDYSANLETGTVNGKIRVDFPITVQGTIGRRISTTLGDGGRTIRATTTNGGVVIRKF